MSVVIAATFAVLVAALIVQTIRLRMRTNDWRMLDDWIATRVTIENERAKERKLCHHEWRSIEAQECVLCDAVAQRQISLPPNSGSQVDAQMTTAGWKLL